MATGDTIIMRRSKEDGTTHPVSIAFAIERLSDSYRDPAGALWASTENVPAETPFALYWSVAS